MAWIATIEPATLLSHRILRHIDLRGELRKQHHDAIAALWLLPPATKSQRKYRFV
jgi:hypothetical protein